jgi:hypothetical protein
MIGFKSEHGLHRETQRNKKLTPFDAMDRDYIREVASWCFFLSLYQLLRLTRNRTVENGKTGE